MGICYAALGMLAEEVATLVVHFSQVCNVLEDFLLLQEAFTN